MTDVVVRMALPCLPAYARVARSAAAACGVLEGFSVDELSDLRLLVDEVFTLMYGRGVIRIEMELTPAAAEVIVRMRSEGSLGPGPIGIDTRLTESLAGVLGHDVHFDLLGTRPSFAATLARS